MNETEKLFRKLSKRNRDELLHIIDTLDDKDVRETYRPIKLTGTDIYRIRKGDFRILYHLVNGVAVVDAVRYRNEKTHKL